MKHILSPVLLIAAAFACALSLTLRVRAFEALDTYRYRLLSQEELECLDRPGRPCPVLSLEGETAPVPGALYRRAALEEGLPEETARRIRAVSARCLPLRDASALTAQANAWLAEQGRDLLPEITQAQARSAAQEAVSALLSGGEAAEGLAAYLLSLEGEDACYDLLGEDALHSARCQTDEAGTVNLTVTLTGRVGGQDSLTLTARRGEETQSRFVLAAGEYRFAFGPGDGEITLTLSGRQYASGCALFLPQDGTGPRLVGSVSGLDGVSVQRQLLPEPWTEEEEDEEAEEEAVSPS